MMKAHLLKKVAVMMVMAAVPLLILAAGIPGQSEYEKGVCYFQGYGIGQDFSKAVKMWKKAAKKGHVKAEFSLGYCYANGVGVEKDIAEAMAWYQEAAEQGDADAQFNLGLMYDEGRGVPQDYREAVAWYRRRNRVMPMPSTIWA